MGGLKKALAVLSVAAILVPGIALAGHGNVGMSRNSTSSLAGRGHDIRPTGKIGAIPEPIPNPAGKMAVTPIQLPKTVGKVGAIPEPIPNPASKVASSPAPQPVPKPAGKVGTLPIPLLNPANKVGSLPIPILKPTSKVGAIPEPIPRPGRK